MQKILLHWALSGLAVWIVSRVVPGFTVADAPAALIAAVAIGLANATLGVALKILTFPLGVLSLGLFWLVINALMILLAAQVVPGFAVAGFPAALWGGIVLCLTNIVLRALLPPAADG